MHVAAFVHRHRRAGFIFLGLIVALLIAALLILSFGWAYLRAPLEQRLSSRFGRPVTIGSIRRVDHHLFTADLRIADVRIAQPGWVGGGAMIAIREALVRLPILPLLYGHADPQSIEVDGLRIALIRRDALHTNWKEIPKGKAKGGGTLDHLVIRDGVLTLDDRKQDHRMTAALSADDKGLRIVGTGTLAGHPSRMEFLGARPLGGGRWPFRLEYRSAIASGTLAGLADAPLDLAHFSARARAWGDDLQHIDLLVEAGLPATQPARVTADVRHDGSDWDIRHLRMRLGRSDFQGDLAVTKRDGRTRIDGAIVSSGMDFDDLSSNAGQAVAAAKRRQLGPRIIPDTAIHLEKLRTTDARVRFEIRHFLSDAPSQLRALRGVVTLDHGVLTADPLTGVLTHGIVTGTVRVRHQTGAPVLAVDLRLADGRVETMLGSDAASGKLTAHIRLTGAGRTIRSAIGKASGTIGIVGRDGAVNRRAALFLGSDAGRALFEGKHSEASMRCLIARFETRSGTAIAAPLLLDTDVARAEGRGTIDLSTERLSIVLKGQPKLARAVQISIPIEMAGTLSDPKIVPKDVPKTVGTVFKLIGNAIGGARAAPAADADCAALAAQALR